MARSIKCYTGILLRIFTILLLGWVYENVIIMLPGGYKLAEDETLNPYMLYLFAKMVGGGGPLDLKLQRDWQDEYYIFDGRVVRYDALGNIGYGIAGTILNISPEMLLSAAGVAQVMDGTSSSSFIFSNFDDPVDQYYIKVGIEYAQHKKGT